MTAAAMATMEIENEVSGDDSEFDAPVLKVTQEDFENAGLTLAGDLTKRWLILGELTGQQITACCDWLEEVPAEGGDQVIAEEWRAAAPKFIRFTGETIAATEDQPAREVIQFVLPESDAKKLKRLEVWKKKIEDAEIAVRDQATKVLALKSKVDEAKADHKSATERWEQLVCVMQQTITDAKSGQLGLPFPDDGEGSPEITEATIDGTSEVLEDYPLSMLSQKGILEIVGADVVESHKSQEDPIGLTEAQLDKLESTCESSTIAGLEKWIAADAWWHKKISGFGDKAINRVTSTLLAFRKVKPDGGGRVVKQTASRGRSRAPEFDDQV